MPIFPIDQICSPGETVTLPKKESRHLTTVLRAKEGDVITVMDPSGGRYEARLIRDGPALGVVIEKGLPPIPDPYPIHLYLSLLKRDKIEWVIQKSVELNIEAVHLVITERSIRQELSPTHMKRLSRIAEEAQKQCGRTKPLEIVTPRDIKTLIPTVNTTQFQNIIFHDSEEGTSLRALFQNNSSFFIFHSSMPVALWIGPEGGWTKEEISFARQNGFHLARLGPLTLRAETAAVAAVAAAIALVF